MKISEFAARNNVTAKMLRHYDSIGLLKPEATDEWTGYRIYFEGQSKYVQWITLLKNLGFSLPEIKAALNGPVDGTELLAALRRKRADIHRDLNEQITKQIQIGRLIGFIEKEGFDVDKNIDLMGIPCGDVREIMKNMPNTAVFREEAEALVSANPGKSVALFAGDMYHMKSINDDFGYDAGDLALVSFYEAMTSVAEGLDPPGFVGRAGGDEFVGCFIAEKERAEGAIQEMIARFAGRPVEGVPRERIGSRFGIVVGKICVNNLREAQHRTYEAIDEAMKIGNGKDCFYTIEG
ncbi:MAG: diguanylate cyclase [Defluviitaleaceae bacterium]|nr:diguanylate cyclase [Defluviitaleaceae bacterium]